jgi:hypothetical protein
MTELREGRRAASAGGLVLALAIAVSSASVAPAAEPQQVQLRFVVAIEKLGMAASNFLTDGKGPGDTVELTLHADIVKPPETIRPGRPTGEAAFATEALAASYEADLSGDAGRIVAGFAAPERAELGAFIAENPDMLGANRDAIAAIERVTVHGWAYFGDYLLILTVLEYPGRSVRRVYPFVETTEGWLKTNGLAADGTFDAVFSAWTQGEVLVIR